MSSINARPVHGLLHWLVAYDVFSNDDLDAALLRHADVHEGQLSRGGQLALKVIEALKKAAAE